MEKSKISLVRSMKAEERRFVLERAYDSWKMNTYVFDEADNLRDVYNRENPAWKDGDRPSNKDDMPLERIDFLKTVRNKCSQKNCPRLISESDGIYYTAFLDQRDWMYVFGPLSVESVSFARLVDYRKRHQIPNSKFKIPVLSLAKGINAIVLIYYMVTGNCVTEEEIFVANNLSTTTKVSPEEVMIYEISAENDRNAFQ